MLSSNGQVIDKVDFRNIGMLYNSPHARFDRDVRSGPGQERIDISWWSFNLYRVIATNYSGSGLMTFESIRCKITIGAEQMLLNFPSTLSGTSHEWHIAELVVVDGIPTIKAL